MQRIIHQYRNACRAFTLLDTLYTYVSDTDYDFDEELWLAPCFQTLVDILQSHLLVFQAPDIMPLDLGHVECSKCDTKEITVCFSGGKDSAAVAYYYQQHGYKVHLYHVAGVNKAYGDEKKAAQKIADYLGCDLFIDQIQTVGAHQYVEHPMKNYVIANGAIHYCLAKGYSPRIAFGNFNQSHLADNAFEVCAGDCIEMWDAYREIIKTVIPEFEIEIPFKTNADTFEILQDNWELLNYAVSCMSPYRFREFWRKRAEVKYGVSILENRCGCCWKCCMEAMWLMDMDKVEYVPSFYFHCYEILKLTIRKETGYTHVDPHTLWNYYMFYPMEKSKGRLDILRGRVEKKKPGPKPKKPKARKTQTKAQRRKKETKNATIQTNKTARAQQSSEG